MTKSPEERIKEAARNHFLEKGYKNTTIREIAEEADINLAMLNYYYKSKDRLFQQIIEEEMESFAPKIRGILEAPVPLADKIETFVGIYTQLLLQTPHLPIFVVSEMRADAGRFLKLSGFREMYRSEPFFHQVTEATQGRVDPRQLYTSMVSLIVYPFVMQPVLRSVYDLTNEEDFRQFVENRRPMVIEATLLMLKGES